MRLEIWLSLAWARFLIRFVAFRRWRGLLGPIGGELPPEQRPRVSSAQAKQAADIARIINRIADRPVLFKAVCLPRAMAGRWVMGRRGLPSRIVIGSRRGEPEEGLLFHAWLMVGDHIVTGAEEREGFMAFGQDRSNQESTGNAA
ncbi:lasso peptide biosynthesis B2 protein [Aurantiacibacter marinus]|uniref:lasso peptide biosynthesis B2 protein n=1 Tax=Aurantiacibacter marinus TaxID=874156 RepID=UPI000699FE74|nr:lasso peptide biosynthesis B2 protein [Aurantiacibacter marinus]